MGSCRSLISVYAPGALPLDARASESPAFHAPGICPTGAAGSVPAEVFVWINAVGLGRVYQRVHNGTGFRTLRAVAEPPVLCTLNYPVCQSGPAQLHALSCPDSLLSGQRTNQLRYFRSTPAGNFSSAPRYWIWSVSSIVGTALTAPAEVPQTRPSASSTS